MAATVQYFIRGGGGVTINGSLTPPTAVQAQQVYVQKALINFLDGDTVASFTHNWGLDASAPTYFDPEVLYPAVVGPQQTAQTWLPSFTFDFSNTNVILIHKTTQAGSGGTYLFGFRRGSLQGGAWQ